VDRLLPPPDRAALQEQAALALRIELSPGALAYAAALHSSSFVNQLMTGNLAMEWAVTRMVSDDPAKGLGLAGPGTLIFDQIKEVMGAPVAQLNLVSPYFVPTGAGVDTFAQLAHSGVRIRVLTNALESTDVAAVHSGYAKHRKRLLEAGVALYELRSLSPPGATRREAGLAGSSTSSLHSKTFGVDRTRVFIGSFNFDPRSARLNTEIGFVIDSPAMAGRISAAFDDRIPAHAYEVRLSAAGQLYWLERRGSTVVRHDVEPGTSFGQRALVWFLSMLPIDWLL
jgi:putative cardiolipin synthase